MADVPNSALLDELRRIHDTLEQRASTDDLQQIGYKLDEIGRHLAQIATGQEQVIRLLKEQTDRLRGPMLGNNP